MLLSTASAPAPKHLFAVYAPDRSAPGALERRLAVRERHLAGVDGLLARGLMKFGGALLAPGLVDAQGRKSMVGSVMFYEAETLEEVRAAVEADAYWTGDVWDKDKLVILPFVPAMHWPAA
ncbi:hypothetical protein BC834DRAFT_830366 [Gloeopeniophorella convolvens]|nr:hypothetical protein BC834DRAFT_830366 [Gloeopeniophorella convolvens]